MNKDIFISFFLICMLLLMPVMVNAVEIKDVSEDHWAYESVKALIEKGYLSLYEDGTFRGKEKVSRYELADLVSRLIKNFSEGDIEASEKDIEILRELSVEFRDELVDLASDQEKLSQQIDKLNREDIVLKESIGNNIENVESMKENFSTLENNLEERLEKISGNINSFNENIDTLRQDLNQSENNLEAQNRKLKLMEEDISKIKDDILGLNNFRDGITQSQQLDADEFSERIINLENNVDNLSSEINNLQTTLSQREETIDEAAIVNIERYKNELTEEMNSLKDGYSVQLSRMQSNLDNKISNLEEENEKQEQKINSLQKETNNYKLYLGAVALLALLIGG